MTDQNQTDLYVVHENLSKYFDKVLKMHNRLLDALTEQFDNEEIDADKYSNEVRFIAVPPALLTCISAFLKTNEIVVTPDVMKSQISQFDKLVNGVAKNNGIDLNDVDHKTEVN